MVRNLRCTVTIDSVLANSKTQNAFLFTVHAIFRHDYPLAVESASTPRPLVQKKTLRDSLPIDMLLSAVSVLVVAQSSSEVPEGLTNNPVFAVLLCLKVLDSSASSLFPLFFPTSFRSSPPPPPTTRPSIICRVQCMPVKLLFVIFHPFQNWLHYSHFFSNYSLNNVYMPELLLL